MSEMEPIEGHRLIAQPSILTLASWIEATYRELDRDEGLAVPKRPGVDALPAESVHDKDALIEALQARIEALPANDPAEALIHVMLASAQIEYLRSCLAGEQADLMARAEHLIGSVIRVLGGEAKLDLAGFGGRRFLAEQENSADFSVTGNAQ